MKRLLFKEEQRFTQWWLWLIIGVGFGWPMISISVSFVTAVSGSKDFIPMLIGLIVLIIITVVVVWLFLKMQLVTEISNTEVRLKFEPLLKKWKTYRLNEIERFEVRRYKPILEYGGWGLKLMDWGNGESYNVKGNIGLQLYLADGRKVLIGSQRKQAIEHAMNKLI